MATPRRFQTWCVAAYRPCACPLPSDRVQAPARGRVLAASAAGEGGWMPPRTRADSPHLTRSWLQLRAPSSFWTQCAGLEPFCPKPPAVRGLANPPPSPPLTPHPCCLVLVLLGLPSLWPLALQPEGAGALSLGALRGRLSCEAWPDHSGKQYATFLKRLYAPLKRPERYARASAWRGLDLRLHGALR